jgi:hypothetical protein
MWDLNSEFRMAPTTLKVKHAGPGRHADVHGLYLLVREGGTRSWVLRMQHAGRRRDFGLGPAHDVPLADARILAANLRKAVRAGIDPRSNCRAGPESIPTFEKVTRDCYDAMKSGWKDKRHASWISSFERHVFPRIGGKAVSAIDSAAVLNVPEPIWLTIPDTAKRVLQRVGTVLDYAHIKRLVPEEVSLRSVTRGLPRQTRQVTHRAAMPHENAPEFHESPVSASFDPWKGRTHPHDPDSCALERGAESDLGRVRPQQGSLVDPRVADEDEGGARGSARAGCNEAFASAASTSPRTTWSDEG